MQAGREQDMATDHLPQKLHKVSHQSECFQVTRKQIPKRNSEFRRSRDKQKKVKGQTEVPQAISSGPYDTEEWLLLKRQEELASYV